MIPKSGRSQASMNTYIGLCIGKVSVHVHDIVSTEGSCVRVSSTQITLILHVNTVKMSAVPQFCIPNNMALQSPKCSIKFNDSRKGNERRPLENNMRSTRALHCVW